MSGSKHTNVLLAAALHYAAKNWYVHPLHGIRDDGICTCGDASCRGPGKHPLTKHGWHDATTDINQIRRWWKRWPWANIGIATGPSGLVVIDIDVGDGKTGEESIAALEARYGAFSETLEAISGGGGRHLYYAANGAQVPSKTAAFGLPDVDTRAMGGTIVAPPSRHKSGRSYAWKA